MELVSFTKYRSKSKVCEAKKGNKEAFLGLIDENRINIYRVARGILKNEEDIKDAIHNTLINSYTNLNTLKNDEYFKTWLIRILINECNKILRDNKNSIILDDEIIEFGNSSRDEYKNFDLVKAIGELEDNLRIVITLFYFEDLSIKDISQIIDIPEGTVKSRLSRARTSLKEILGGDYYYER
ncbi:MAG TPA: sigma-70 family RNA polymerase sigma factor [Tissierellaceae bacterium]